MTIFNPFFFVKSDSLISNNDPLGQLLTMLFGLFKDVAHISNSSR